MEYRRSGESGLQLPLITLGLWHNFGSEASVSNMTQMLRTAFDHGINSFDLANNYGPVPGSAEENFGRILRQEFASHRDEMTIITKAGHDMWDGTYGKGASRKHLVASLDQSLRRMGLDYVDIFYTHCPDPNTPLEETMQALSDIVSSGKALYIGISKYSAENFRKSCDILKEFKRTPIIYQGRYSLLAQEQAQAVLPSVDKAGCGFAAFSPLAQGLLSNRYINEIPCDSRAAGASPFLSSEQITPEMVAKLRRLNDIAAQRGQTLAQMAISWLLSDQRVTTVVTGASRTEQILDTLRAVENIAFCEEELQLIDKVLKSV